MFFKFLLGDDTIISAIPFSVPFLKKDLSYLFPKHKPRASIIIDFPEPVSPVSMFRFSPKLTLLSSTKAQFFIYNSRIILCPLYHYLLFI